MLKIITAKTEDEAEDLVYDLWEESDENTVAWDCDGVLYYAYSYGQFIHWDCDGDLA